MHVDQLFNPLETSPVTFPRSIDLCVTTKTESSSPPPPGFRVQAACRRILPDVLIRELLFLLRRLFQDFTLN